MTRHDGSTMVRHDLGDPIADSPRDPPGRPEELLVGEDDAFNCSMVFLGPGEDWCAIGLVGGGGS